MKTLFIILVGVCLMTTSCSKDELPEPEQNKKQIGPKKWPTNREKVDSTITVKLY